MFGHFAFMPGVPQPAPAWGAGWGTAYGGACGGAADVPPRPPAERAHLQQVIEQDAALWRGQKFAYAASYRQSGQVRDLGALQWCATMETVTLLLGPLADNSPRYSLAEIAELSRACILGFQRMEARGHGHSHSMFLLRRHDLLQLMISRKVDNELRALRHSPRYSDFLRCMTELCACDNPARGLNLLREAYLRLGRPWPDCSPSLMNHPG